MVVAVCDETIPATEVAMRLKVDAEICTVLKRSGRVFK